MPTWAVSLIGESIDLQELVRLFNADKARVVHRNDQFDLESDDFTTLDAAIDVHTTATALLASLNGAATLHIPYYKPVRVGAVHELFEDGRRSAHVFAEGFGPIRFGISASGTVGGAPTVGPVTPIGSRLVELAARYPIAHEVLELLAKGAPDWVALYKLLECIERSVSKAKFTSWISNSDLRLIRHTANSAAAIGVAARHTRVYTKTPKQPMSIDEARIKVLHVVRNWLDALLTDAA